LRCLRVDIRHRLRHGLGLRRIQGAGGCIWVVRVARNWACNALLAVSEVAGCVFVG
jgi:hypothetical protein